MKERAAASRTIRTMADKANGPLVLAGEFPKPTRAQWLELVEGVLKGRPFDKVLVNELYDGIAVQPLYAADGADASDARLGVPGAAPYVRGSSTFRGNWDVRQRHVVYDAATVADTNAAVLADLERGATSVWLRADPGVVPAALEGVYLDLAPVVLDAGADFAAAADALITLWQARGVAGSAVSGGFGADPLGHGGDLSAAVDLAKRATADFPDVRTFTVDGTVYHDAGGSDAEELGCSIAAGVAYLRALLDAGLDLATAASQLEFRYAASSDQFSTIAKLRAARRLWARVTEVCGATQPQLQHAVTSEAMFTQRDPWVNMLRGTIACFAAAVGGADAITVLPFDAAIGRSDSFARRVAANTQALLLDESNVGRVADPAGGSWYVENLTDALAKQAWAWFQQIEGAGGLSRALDDGVVQARLDATWQARSKNIARRKDPITGVSEFPNVAEQPVVREPAPDAAASGRARRLPLRRYAAGFEALRDRADRASARPSVFLANLGPLAVHTARTGFARNFFEVAGFDVLGNDGFDSPVAAASAFADSGATLVCICSSDDVYDERAEATALALREAGATRIYLAGRRDTPGVDEFIFTGCDALDVLTRALDTLGAA